MEVLYEDNHLIAVNKRCGEIVQGDQTGDKPLSELVADYLVEKYNKPGKAFIGVIHRLDRPTSGVVIFAKTSKGLSRMNELFRKGEVDKRYHALVAPAPEMPTADLTHYLLRNTKQNKSYVVAAGTKEAKEARLTYHTLGRTDRYALLEVELHTGRHHQIRAQLASIDCFIKGDLKYGAPRSNRDGGISLHARSVSFIHPVSKEPITIEAPYPESDSLWRQVR